MVADYPSSRFHAASLPNGLMHSLVMVADYPPVVVVVHDLALLMICAVFLPYTILPIMMIHEEY